MKSMSISPFSRQRIPHPKSLKPSRLKAHQHRFLASILLALTILFLATPSSKALLPPTLDLVGVYWGDSPDRTLQPSPGDQNVPLSIVLQNNDVMDLIGIEARLSLASTPFTGRLGEDFAITNVPGITLRMGAQATLVFYLNIAPDAELKTYQGQLSFYYKVSYGKEAINLSVPIPLLGRVKLQYASSASFLPIGNSSYKLSISNVGTAVAKSVLVSASIPSPLAVIGGSPSASIPSLAPGENVSIALSLYAPEKAVGTSYRISLTTTYVDAYGFTKSETGAIDLIVSKTEVQVATLSLFLDQPEACVGSRIRLYGSLIRRDTGAGLAGATVELEILDPELFRETRSLITNPYGQYEELLTLSKVGTYSIIARFKGGSLPETPWIFYTPSSSQATIRASPILEILCPKPWQVTEPGGRVTFSLQILNKGPRTEKYLLNLKGLPADWDARFYSEGVEVKAIEIQPLQTATISVSLRIPEEAHESLLHLRFEAKGEETLYSYALTISVEHPFRRIALKAPFRSITAMTGEDIAYPLEILNEGDEEEQVYLYVNRTGSTMDWRFSFTLDGKIVQSVSLLPKENTWLFLVATPPYLVKVGSYPIRVFVASADARYNASLGLTANVVGLYKLEVTFNPINPEVITGESGEVSVVVRNTGQSPVTSLRLNVTAHPSMKVETIPMDVLSLSPNERASFLLRVSPSLSATEGTYIITVQAVSQEGSFDRREIPITVKTAIPWHWIEIALAAIAAAIATLGLQRLFSKLRVRISKR